MVQFMLLKTNGRSIEGDPVIERLVEIRTVNIVIFCIGLIN